MTWLNVAARTWLRTCMCIWLCTLTPGSDRRRYGLAVVHVSYMEAAGEAARDAGHDVAHDAAHAASSCG